MVNNCSSLTWAAFNWSCVKPILQYFTILWYFPGTLQKAIPARCCFEKSTWRFHSWFGQQTSISKADCNESHQTPREFIKNTERIGKVSIV